MSITSSRPEHLPDFQKPPLNEVVIGVQFQPPKGYLQINAGEVWGLYRPEYPLVQEHEALAPTFETFGLISPRAEIKLVSGALHDRFWFLRKDGQELIQFQQDRLLHNWRKVGDEANEYPRFESMIPRLKDELTQLEQYFNGLAPQSLVVNQAEITYVNHFEVDEKASPKPSDWLNFLVFDECEPADFSITFREEIRNEKGEPRGRLIYEASTGIKANGKRIIGLTLTVRGAPNEATIDSAMEFISQGRDKIVMRFAQLTTKSAHIKWGRIK